VIQIVVQYHQRSWWIVHTLPTSLDRPSHPYLFISRARLAAARRAREMKLREASRFVSVGRI
jgi:hypothetical protein